MNPGATANGVPADHFPVHGHGFHMPQQPQNRDHWPQMLPQNQPQQFPGPWQQSQPLQLPSAPQMPVQGYSNAPQYFQNHNSSQLDISSIIPQQVMQDFLRLSTPVGSSPNDDTILAQALHESKRAGKTYRQALEGLHGINNHAANLWKDYYLDHHDRFDVLVSRLAEQPKTVKKPIVINKSLPRIKEVDAASSPQVARKRHISPSSSRQVTMKRERPSISSQASRQKRATPQATTPAPSTLTRPPKRPRATFNSLSAPLPSGDVPNLMPPQADIPLPEPPSRSPTPPAIIQIGSNGNKYTKEDREYFLKFLVWRLKEDPSLSKKELCELLHQKAPHHSASSWASHWHQRHDIADKILATYNNSSKDGAEDDEDQQDEEEEVEVEEEMKHDEDDDARSESMSATEHSRQRGVFRSQGTFPDFDGFDADTEEDERDMGEFGSSFTRGDWCTLARFIAKNHWDVMTQKERWNNFTESRGTKRSAKSWAEFYRKNEVAILKLSKKYSLGSNRDKSRRGRSSWRNKPEPPVEVGFDEDGEYEIDNEDT